MKNKRRELIQSMKAVAKDLDAGNIPADSCQRASLRTKNSRLRQALQTAALDMSSSRMSFHKAFGRHTEVFPDSLCKSLMVGEVTGNYAQYILQYTKHEDLVIEYFSNLRSSLVYPAMVAVMSLTLFVCLLFFFLEV